MAMPLPIRLPARCPKSVARDLGDEIIVLVPASQQAHRLTGRDADAWRRAGETTDDGDLIAHASRLQELGVLDRDGISRRTLLARAGLVAASAPLVSVALPMARAAASVSSITSFSVTSQSCSTHTITQATVATTGTKNQSYVITFSWPSNTGGFSGSLTGSGRTDGNSGKDNIVVTGNLQAPSAGTFTVNWTTLDTTDNVASTGTIQITFC